MKNIRFASLTVFVLFFGIALIEAIQQHNWPVALLFLALGALSFWADTRKPETKMKYAFSPAQQVISGIISFLTAAAVTGIFDHQVKWALAVAVGIGTAVTSGFYKKP